MANSHFLMQSQLLRLSQFSSFFWRSPELINFQTRCRRLSSLRTHTPKPSSCCAREANTASNLRHSSAGKIQRRAFKTVQQARTRYKTGPFTWKAGLLFLLTGGSLILYFNHEKERMRRKRIAEATKGVGKPKVGGPFELIDHNGMPFTSEDMKGKYALIYFGFSHCPDICPEELDKMARALDIISSSPISSRLSLLPIFITCDPARDSPGVLKAYLSEFHPSLIGLTGTWEQVKDVCKKYRVYFSTPEGVKKGQDYLVDHSIYFYLMDPEGDFVEAIGRQHSPEAAARLIVEHMGDWGREK